MTSTFRRQLAEIGLQDRCHDILAELPRVREELGWPIMVTPLSQFVGVQAYLNVTTGERWSQVPDEIVRYVLGQTDRRRRDRSGFARGCSARRGRRRSSTSRMDRPRRRAGSFGDISDELLLLRMMLPEIRSRRPSRRGAKAVDRAHPLRTLVAGLVERDPAYVQIGTPGLRVRARRHVLERVRRGRGGRVRRRRHTAPCERSEWRQRSSRDPRRDRSGRTGACSGRPVLFFTNGTGRAPARAAADLRSVGFDLADEEYMNPAVVAAGWIARKHEGKSVLVLGGEGVRAPLRDLVSRSWKHPLRRSQTSCSSAGTTR